MQGETDPHRHGRTHDGVPHLSPQSHETRGANLEEPTQKMVTLWDNVAHGLLQARVLDATVKAHNQKSPQSGLGNEVRDMLPLLSEASSRTQRAPTPRGETKGGSSLQIDRSGPVRSVQG